MAKQQRTNDTKVRLVYGVRSAGYRTWGEVKALAQRGGGKIIYNDKRSPPVAQITGGRLGNPGRG